MSSVLGEGLAKEWKIWGRVWGKQFWVIVINETTPRLCSLRAINCRYTNKIVKESD